MTSNRPKNLAAPDAWVCNFHGTRILAPVAHYPVIFDAMLNGHLSWMMLPEIERGKEQGPGTEARTP